MRHAEWVIDRLIIGALLISLLAGCGGPPASPTPLPAALVRPPQPAPVYPESTAFTLLTPTVTPPAVAPAQPDSLTGAVDEATPAAPALPLHLAQIQSPPTGLGIVRGGAALLDAPNGVARQQLPAGAVVTITGKSSDGAWVAAYDEQGTSGWLAANRLVLFGTATLTVVTEAWGPGLAATMVAQAMEPLAMPTIVLTGTVEP